MFSSENAWLLLFLFWFLFFRLRRRLFRLGLGRIRRMRLILRVGVLRMSVLRMSGRRGIFRTSSRWTVVFRLRGILRAGGRRHRAAVAARGFGRCRRSRFARRNRRRAIRRSGGLGGYHTASAELTRTRCCCDCRRAMIGRGEQSLVLAGRMFLLHLRRYRGGMRLTRKSFFPRRRTRLNAALAAVKSNVGIVVHNHRSVHVHIRITVVFTFTTAVL